MPVSEQIITRTKGKLSIPLIVGGGIRDPITAEAIARAGADIIVTGTVAEKTVNVYDTLKPIINIIHKTKN